MTLDANVSDDVRNRAAGVKWILLDCDGVLTDGRLFMSSDGSEGRSFHAVLDLAWREGDSARTRELLEQARLARGEEWRPEGTTAEGDVRDRMHEERSPLARFWETWDGSTDPDAVFAGLHAHLQRFK